LKTAVRFFFEKSAPTQTDQVWQYDLCASFQKAVVDVLVRKSVQAVTQARAERLAVSGGVLCNKMLRDELEFACYEAGIDLVVAEPAFCTDNAGMIAGTAAEKLAAGIAPRCGDDINPNLDLFSPEPHGDMARGLNAAMKLKNRQTKQLPKKSDILAPGEIEVW
jgi:N6-L-threonylcarbamoyladenine synthase